MDDTLDAPLVRRIVEAALLASHTPLTPAQLAELFPEQQPAPAGSIEKALEALREEAPQRGIELVEVASGFRFQVRSEVQPWVARLWTERQTRYSRAMLETLALIAYRQPITRGEIEQIRGVAVSSNIIKTMEEREWIRVVGHRDVPGKPALFGTTRTFLDYFGLKSLDQLPPLAELAELPDLEPQLPLEGAVDGAAVASRVDDATAAPSEPITATVADESPGSEADAAEEDVDNSLDDTVIEHGDQASRPDAELAAPSTDSPHAAADSDLTPDTTDPTDDATRASSEQNA